MKYKYSNINTKIQKLRNKQKKKKTHKTNNFYKCIENLSNITFTDDKTQLLSKGLKYNLHYKRKTGSKHLHWKPKLLLTNLTQENKHT
jgi:hypothetical protein